MNEIQSEFERFQELASLPANNPLRRQFLAQVQAMESDQRDFWLAMMEETDALCGGLDRVEMPAGLEQRLLQIPQEILVDLSPRAVSRKARGWAGLRWPVFYYPAGLTHVAASLIFLVGLAAYLLWPTDWRPSPLSASLANEIARRAVEIHESPSTPQLASSDVAHLEKTLADYKLPFQVVFFNPEEKMTLRGGGVCDFEGAPAVYTRWQADGVNYTVYQFAGTKLGIPDLFPPTTAVPRDLWHGSHHYRVVIWRGPDEQSNWAVVMESDAAHDVFSEVY